MNPADEPSSRTGEPAHDASRNRPLRWLWDTFSFYLVLTLLAVCFSGWSLLAFPLSLILPRRLGQWVGQSAINMFFRVFLATMRGLGIADYDLSALNTLHEARGVVFVANHIALLDILLLGSRLPRTTCIIKASLWDNPLLGGGRLAGYIRNDEAISLIRRSMEALQEGSNLLIFPEGTRHERGQLGTFRPGFALIARKARAPVQPIFIESNSPYLAKGWPLWRRPAFPLMYRATLGMPQHVEGRAEAFSTALRAAFLVKLQIQ